MKIRMFSVISLIVSLTLLLAFGLGGVRPTVVQAQGGFSCATVTEIPQVECEALVALYNSTNGANWSDNSGWLDTSMPCSWFGVTCYAGHVTRLGLSYNDLSGSIPSELSNLANLEILQLYGNQLSGSIPTEFGNLANPDMPDRIIAATALSLGLPLLSRDRALAAVEGVEVIW